MGADLFIENIQHDLIQRYGPRLEEAIRRSEALPKCSTRWKAAHMAVGQQFKRLSAQGYFHEAYNVAGVLPRLELSWWRDAQPLLNKHQQLNGDSLRRFRDRVAAAELRLPGRKELAEMGVLLKPTGKNSLAGWHRHFICKHRELLAFLEQAMASGSAIRCSL